MADYKDADNYVYLSYRYQSTSEAMQRVCAMLDNRLRSSQLRRSKTDFSEAFNVVLTNLEVLRAYNPDQWIRIVTDYEVFSGAYQRSSAHTTQVHRVLLWLIESGYLHRVDKRRFFKGKDGYIPLPCAYVMTDLWRQEISEKPLCRDDEIVRNKLYARVQLRNKNKTGKKLSKRSYSMPITPDHRQAYAAVIDGSEALIQASDALWAQTTVTLRSEPVLSAKFFMNRIFNEGSFERGGRFYSAQQNMSSIERQYLRFNGDPTVEIDFAAMHPVLLYQLNGLSCKDDPYIIEGYERNQVKKAFNTLLNTTHKAKKPTARSMGNIFMKAFDYDKKQSLALTQAIFERHKDIQHFFGKGYGLTLQHIDSVIAYEVMHHFVMVMKQPIFMVHDSAIVSVRHAESLLITMAESYQQVLSKRTHAKHDFDEAKSYLPKCLNVDSLNFTDELTQMIYDSLSGKDFTHKQWDDVIERNNKATLAQH